ncbi:MAG: ATP-binding protein [Christensenellaceae bacterium]|jgi:predicted AAA+ superfamily ATPase|nr:ATP-binding protein [Christensenellaceae bacterium]
MTNNEKPDKIVEREVYTDRIKDFIDKPLIKIITGLHRSGKSNVLNLVMQEIAQCVDAEHIIRINFEDVENQWIKTNLQLNEHILSFIKDNKCYYLFLNEPQLVDGWEKSVNGFRLKNTDIYITGSNSKLLSGEFATLLAGRYVKFDIHGLSLREFIKFRNAYGIGTDDENKELDDYIEIGGFPLLSTMKFTPDAAHSIIQDINSSAVIKDVIERKKLRNPELLKKLVAFVYDNIGNSISVSSITKYLKDEETCSDPNTITEYLGYLEDAFIVHRVQKFDVKGKTLLKTNDKFYLGEHSLQYALFGSKPSNKGKIIENIVYLELLRRKYNVTVGNIQVAMHDKNNKRITKTLEIDFAAEKYGSYIYVQVCLEFSDYTKTKVREFAPLLAINNHYPKYVVTLDRMWRADENGVKGIHLKDFLLKQEL